MWLRNLKYYLRVFSKSRFYFFLNLAGLALGIGVAIIIAIYIKHELTFDKHYAAHKSIYRISPHFYLEEEYQMAASAMGIGPLMKREYKEIESFVRLGKAGVNIYLSYEGQDFYSDEVYFADSNYFELFETAFIMGNPKKCFKNEQCIVLTESFAKEVFGDENPLGKVIQTNNNWFAVTAVIKDMPENSHVRFSALIPGFMRPISEEDMVLSLWSTTLFTYVKLSNDVNPQKIEDSFYTFYDKYMADVGDAISSDFSIHLERLDKIHLSSTADFDLNRGNLRYLFAFGGIGLIILMLATINYINMATALTPVRAKEAGIRKILGSGRKALVFQFLGESVLLALLSLFFAWSGIELILNSEGFKTLAQIDFARDFYSNWLVWIGGLFLAVVVGLNGGWYPAWRISRISTLYSLKGYLKTNKKEAFLRMLLVGFQVVASITLVMVSLSMVRQLNYVKTKDLGFNKQDVILIPIQDTAISSKMDEIGELLMKHEDILSYSTSSTIMGSTVGKSIVRTDSLQEENEVVDFMIVDGSYFETMQIELLEGRAFHSSDKQSQHSPVIVNQAFMSEMGWRTIENKFVYSNIDEDGYANSRGKVIGVSNNFNAFSLKEDIRPLVFYLQQHPEGSIHLRVNSRNIFKVIAFLEEEWTSIDKRHPLEYSFLNKEIQQLYSDDRRLTQFVEILTTIAIIISCIGLLSLASFTTRRKAKELAIRKVLGASTNQVLGLILWDISKILLTSSVLSIPLAVAISNLWQENFVEVVSISLWSYGVTIALAFILAFTTVGFHALQAARANPVETLKYE